MQVPQASAWGYFLFQLRKFEKNTAELELRWEFLIKEPKSFL